MSDHRHLFDRFTTPSPPPELRDRALRAARAAGREAVHAVPTTSGWSPWDLAWATALLVLLVSHLSLTRHDGPRGLVAEAQKPVTARTPATHRLADVDWREIGIQIAAYDPKNRPGRSPEGTRQLDDPLLRTLATE